MLRRQNRTFRACVIKRKYLSYTYKTRLKNIFQITNIKQFRKCLPSMSQILVCEVCNLKLGLYSQIK